MDALQQTLKNIGLVRLALLAALLVGVGSGLYYVTAKFNTPDMALLYGDIELADAGKIVGRLEAMDVKVEVRGGGGQLYVPADQVARLRLELAEMSLPKSGTMGYEIFDQQDSMGVSSFVQGVQHVRALEGEISRTINAMAQVSHVRVHLVLPKRKLFSREADEPSAAIMLSLAGPGRLSSQKIQAIQQLVAAAVPGLTVERVSIVDDRGNLLARGDGDSNSYSSVQLDERKIAYENRLSQIIENLVGKYVGDGRVRAEVSVEMDFDRVTENDESFNPDGQVVRSSQTVKTGDEATEAPAQSSSVENKLPNAQAGGGQGGSKSNRTEETINYEVSKKLKTHIKETGGLKRLSVAVLVDGALKPGAKGQEPTYTPRPDAELKQLTKLVQSAIGYNKERGDVVEVINMKFAPMEAMEADAKADPFLGFSKHDIVRLVETLIFALVGLLILLMVIKPMISRILEGMKEQNLPDKDPQAALSGPTQPMLQAANSSLALGQEQGNMALAGHSDSMVDMKQVDGQVRASSLKTVGDIIDNNLDEAVGVVRGWMAEKG